MKFYELLNQYETMLNLLSIHQQKDRKSVDWLLGANWANSIWFKELKISCEDFPKMIPLTEEESNQYIDQDTNEKASFKLNYRDKNHLDKFLKAINSTAVIKIIDGAGFGASTKIASLQINSNKMVKDLNNLGIVQRKSLILSKPNIEEKYYYDWIRGYFDGDGSITVELSNGNSQINFLGTKEVLDFIQEVLRPEKINKLHQNNLNKNTFSLTYGGKSLILQLLDKFYKDPIVYLDRKYEKVLKVYSRFEEQSSKL